MSTNADEETTSASLVNATPGELASPEVPDRLNPGGLFRCCTDTVEALYPDGPARLATEGQILQCKYSQSANHRMVFQAGVWRWLRTEDEIEIETSAGELSRRRDWRWNAH